MLLQREREWVAEYGRRLVRAGLATGTFGNLSAFCRERGLMAISPSGMDYFGTAPEDVSVVDLDGRLLEGARPSSEVDLHLVFYRRRPGAGGVVHTHSPYATTLACLGWPIDPVHYLAAYGGRAVPCIPYHPFGTAELAEAAYRAMDPGCDACLLGGHGLVAVGPDLPFAFDAAEQLEFASQLTYRTRLAGGGIPLTPGQLDYAAQKLRGYGQGRGALSVAGKNDYI